MADIQKDLFEYGFLILFILISWIISMVMRKVRSPEKREQTAEKESAVPILEQLFGQQSPEQAGPDDDNEQGRRMVLSDSEAPMPQSDYRGPVVTPDPIKPKWWGS